MIARNVPCLLLGTSGGAAHRSFTIDWLRFWLLSNCDLLIRFAKSRISPWCLTYALNSYKDKKFCQDPHEQLLCAHVSLEGNLSLI
jgi:hypothetical protein